MPRKATSIRKVPAAATSTRGAMPDTYESLLSAARQCYERLGIDKTTMSDIADTAGTARRTLYRYFPNAKEILNAVVQREVEKFWKKFDATHSEITEFSDYVISALIYSIRFGPRTATHRFLFNDEILPLVHEIYIHDRAHIQRRADAFRAASARLGNKAHIDMLMLAEWFNRISISFMAGPSCFFHKEEELKALFTAMLEPALRPKGK